jgi:predicted nucleic acid-binding protein
VRALGQPKGSAGYAWLAAIDEGRVRAHVPDLVYLETASALSKYVRAGALTLEEADRRLAQAIAAPLEAVTLRLLSRQALALAFLRRISPYDACYLALAIGYDAVLVTADRRLAAEAEKVALLPRDYPPVG